MNYISSNKPERMDQGAEPGINRSRKSVLTVIILQIRSETEPEKIKFVEPEFELELYFKRFRFRRFDFTLQSLF